MFSTLQDKSFKKRAIFAEGEEWPVDDSCPLHKPVNFIGEKGGGEKEGGIDPIGQFCCSFLHENADNLPIDKRGEGTY